MARYQRHHNRYTGADMTAREAQTLIGIMKKLRVLEKQMNARDIYAPTVKKLTDAEQLILSAILESGRANEIVRN